MRRKRNLLAGSLAVAALLFAPTASADDLDDQFVAVLDEQGIAYASPEAAVQAADMVCDMLDAAEERNPGTPGSTIAEGVVLYVSQETGLSEYDAGYFTGAAIGGYCIDNMYMVPEQE